MIEFDYNRLTDKGTNCLGDGGGERVNTFMYQYDRGTLNGFGSLNLINIKLVNIFNKNLCLRPRFYTFALAIILAG
jgi:hypothetical protein